jgi:uncharacterized protein YpmB
VDVKKEKQKIEGFRLAFDEEKLMWEVAPLSLQSFSLSLISPF